MRKSNGDKLVLALAFKRVVCICLAVAISLFLVLQGLIFSGARSEVADVDCLIILGAGINGENPSGVLKSRLDTALEF